MSESIHLDLEFGGGVDFANLEKDPTALMDGVEDLELLQVLDPEDDGLGI